MSKSFWLILGIIIGILVLAGVFWLGLNFSKVRSLLGDSSSRSTATDESTKNGVDKDLTTDSNSSNEVDKAKNGNDWTIFKNLGYNYLIEFPNNAAVVNASTEDGEKDKPANVSKCAEVSSKYVTVKILARNVEDGTYCLTTGFGTEWSNSPEEKITAAGMEYTANGMHTESASAGYYKDVYFFQAVSGERFEYSVSVNEKYDDQMTKVQAKALAHKIIGSFSPAE